MPYVNSGRRSCNIPCKECCHLNLNLFFIEINIKNLLISISSLFSGFEFMFHEAICQRYGSGGRGLIKSL